MAFDDYLSAYQKMMGPRANNQYSPDNPFIAPNQGGSTPQANQFSRLLPNHDRVANALDSALMVAAMVPQSNTVGGNISGVAQAVLGLPQAQLQRQAGLMKPAQDWENQQAEINQKNMTSFGNLMQGKYYAERGDIERYQEDQATEREKMMVNKPIVDTTEHFDDNGEGPYKSIYKPETGASEFRYMGHGPEPTNPTFKSEAKNRVNAGTTYAERVIADRNKERVAAGLPPMDTNESLAYANEKIWGPMSGARAGGALGATDPLRSASDADESTYKMSLFPNVNPTDEELASEYTKRRGQPGFTPMKMLSDIPAERQATNIKVDSLWNTYQRLPPAKRTGFSTYLQQNGYDAQTRTFTNRPGAAAPTVPGKVYTEGKDF